MAQRAMRLSQKSSASLRTRKEGVDMEYGKYLIDGKVYGDNAEAMQVALARAYAADIRPRCMCVKIGVEMYISKFKDYVIKRMPDTGTLHHPSCQSYELPASESGLGQVIGEAIIERSAELVEIRVDFALTRRIGKAFPAGEGGDSGEVHIERKRLSLRGLLHYLWERAGFNRWYPRMEGKRNYWIMRKHLLQAAREVETKGVRLTERLFIPESYSPEQAEEITKRRAKQFALLRSPDENVQFKMMITIGEIKDFKPSGFGGCRVMLKHMPDSGLQVDEKGWARIKKVFSYEIAEWEINKGKVKLITACVFFEKRENVFEIDAMTMMMVDEHWVPVDSAPERALCEKLVREKRAFIKPLRYEAKQAGGFPNFKLVDVGDQAMALDVVSAFANEKERAAKTKALAERAQEKWVWDTAKETDIPALPAPARRDSGGIRAQA
jgi:hypothetical protein